MKEGIVEKFINWMFPTSIERREKGDAWTYTYKSGWFSSVYSYVQYSGRRV